MSSTTKAKTIGKAAESVQPSRQAAAHQTTTQTPAVAKKDNLSAIVQRAQNAQPVVQTKIKMGVVGDAHEQQADAMAEQVLSMSQQQLQRQHLRIQPRTAEKPQRKEEIKKQEINKKEELQKQELKKKEELKKKDELQKQELKKKEELKKKDELQKQELKKKEELKKKDELQKQELKKKEELKKKDELQKQELKKKEELKKKDELQKQELKKKDEPLKKKADEKVQKSNELQKVAIDKAQPKIIAAKAVQPKEELKKKDEQLSKKSEEKVQKQQEVQKSAAEKVQSKITPVVSAKTVQPKEELKKKDEQLGKKTDEKVQKQQEVQKAAAEKVQPKIAAAAVSAKAVQPKEELKKKSDEKLQKQQEVQKASADKAQPKLVATKMRDQREMERDIKPALPVQSNMQAAVSIQQKSLDTTQKEKPSEERRAPGTLPVSSGMQSALSQEQHKVYRKEEKVQHENAVPVDAPQDEVPPHIEEQLRNVSGGRAMEPGIRSWMEQRFGVSFAAVRIHTDSQAVRLCNELGAHAFAYGSNIFFNSGKYDPESTEGKRLLAHELTHVIQQGYAPESNSEAAEAAAQVQQKSAPEVQKSAPEVQKMPEVQKAEPVAQKLPSGVSHAPLSVQRGIWDRVNNAVRYVVPPWTLITVIFGYNPILGANVARSPINWFNALLDLVPVVGPAIFDLLRGSGLLGRAQQWLDAQLARLPSLGEISSTWDRCWEEMGIRHGIDGNIAIFRRHFGSILSRITNFVGSALAEVVRLLRETLLRPLNNVIKDIPGWTLITALIGSNPLTGESVPRTATNILRGVAAFIPGGEEKFNQLVESRALERAYQWFITETTKRNLTWPRIRDTFTRAWDTLQASDILHPIDTFRRLAGIFSPLLSDLVSFCGAALLKLLEFIFEAVMGAGGADVLAIIKRAQQSFTLIIQNPVGFLGNLLRGIGQGVRQFMSRILTHLQQGVIRWLTGPVARAGIQMPPQWDAKGILFFVLQILGLTYANIRTKMVRLMGERAVGMLETGFQLVQEIREKGFVEAMKDRISEFFGNFRDMILGRIKSFIQERIVTAGITQLLSLLSPVGAVIQAIMKTYTTIKFFIDKIQQILAFVRSVVDSVHRLATGDVSGAANFIEGSIAQTIPIVLDFLARFIGLGDVGGHVQRTIRGVQGWVDQKLDLGVDWIKRQALRLVTAGTPLDPQERLNEAHRAALGVVNRFAGRPVGAAVLTPLLAVIKTRYRLTDIIITPARSRKWNVKVLINPFKEGEADAFAIGENTPAGLDPDRTDLLNQVTIVSSAGRAGSFKPRNPKHQDAYVANVPLYSGHQKQPVDIANQYRNQGFNNPQDADQRLALVIGVNRFRDARGNSDTAIRSRVNMSGWAPTNFPVGVFGFTWNMPWTNAQGRRIDDIRAYYNSPNTGSAEDDNRIKQEIITKEDQLINEIRDKRRYPYGVFRDTVLQSNYTQSFIASMNANANNVQLHTGDPDVVNMRTSAVNDNDVNALLNPAAQQVADGLFNRYDQFFQQLRQQPGPMPLVTTGGYRFSFTIPLSTQTNLSTIAASVLDMNIRRAMHRINPRSVYFPEPNTLFNVTNQNATTILSSSFGVGSNEGRTFLNNLMANNGAVPTAFADVPLETGMDDRFIVNANGVNGSITMNGSYYGYIPPNLAAIRSILNQSQSHANRRQWINNVGNSYNLRLSERTPNWFIAFGKIFDASMNSLNTVLRIDQNSDPRLRAIFTRSGRIRRNNALSTQQIADVLIQQLTQTNVNNPVYQTSFNAIINEINLDVKNLANSTQIANEVKQLASAVATEIKSFLISGLTSQ